MYWLCQLIYLFCNCILCKRDERVRNSQNIFVYSSVRMYPEAWLVWATMKPIGCHKSKLHSSHFRIGLCVTMVSWPPTLHSARSIWGKCSGVDILWTRGLRITSVWSGVLCSKIGLLLHKQKEYLECIDCRLERSIIKYCP